MNIIVGDNEAGKSTILEAIDLVISGNIRKVENIGIDRIINTDSIDEFLKGSKKYDKLPVVRIELFLNGDFGFEMEGKNNSDEVTAYGIRMVCAPNPEFEHEIIDSIKADPNFFPYDYYTVRFSTFADEGYSGYKKRIRSVFIDSSNHKSKFRQIKNQFEIENLAELNARVPDGEEYSFKFRGNDSSNFSDELMIYEKSVPLDSKGTGTQIFVKVDFVLSHSGENVEVILIEEPENHLSHVKLRALIEKISDSNNGQLFITTHNSLISTRLELNNVFILQGNEINKPLALSDLKEETAKYFMKTPPASIVEFALASKVILVEGPAEFMLIERFYMTVTGHQPEDDGVQIIDIRGLSFLRYLEIAKLTKGKVGVITDNDNDAKKNCIEKYSAYANDSNIKVFYEPDNEKRTFEIVLYSANSDLCNSLFRDDAQEYMLKNKTEAAFAMLSQKQPIVVPDYIKRAIEWIKE